ncbi:hypothetical protein [Streptomyces collinus]|uniref:hypothetical protein n=1 Tax=Streptomyces collinus TaxID=42684 RepID=UPI0037D894A2
MCYLLAAAAGLSALFAAVPVAFIVVKLAGAADLGYLAWSMVKPGGSSPFAPAQDLPPVSDARRTLRERSDHAGRSAGLGVSCCPASRHGRPAIHGRWPARSLRATYRPVPPRRARIPRRQTDGRLGDVEAA